MFSDFCRRGSLLSTAIFVYAATSPVNGYFGGSLYARMGGSCTRSTLFSVKNLPFIEIYVKVLTFLQFQWRFVVNVKQGMGFPLNFYFPVIGKVWIKQMMVGAFMLPLAVCGTAFFINFIAIYYHASRAIPFGTMVSWFYSVYLKLS